MPEDTFDIDHCMIKDCGRPEEHMIFIEGMVILVCEEHLKEVLEKFPNAKVAR